LHTFSRRHDSELEGLAHRIVTCEDKVEDVCTELAALKQEDDARAIDEHRRAFTGLTTHAECPQGPQAEIRAAV